MPFFEKLLFKSIRFKLIFGFLIVMLSLYNNFYAIEGPQSNREVLQ
ncbi:hypothetical protein ACFQZR_08585 [Paenibacillus sp. GCM10027629]